MGAPRTSRWSFLWILSPSLVSWSHSPSARCQANNHILLGVLTCRCPLRPHLQVLSVSEALGLLPNTHKVAPVSYLHLSRFSEITSVLTDVDLLCPIGTSPVRVCVLTPSTQADRGGLTLTTLPRSAAPCTRRCPTYVTTEATFRWWEGLGSL